MEFNPIPEATGCSRKPPILGAEIGLTGHICEHLLPCWEHQPSRHLCIRLLFLLAPGLLPCPKSLTSPWHNSSRAEQGLWPTLVQFYSARVGWERLGSVVGHPVHGSWFSPKTYQKQVWRSPAPFRRSQHPAFLCQ